MQTIDSSGVAVVTNAADQQAPSWLVDSTPTVRVDGNDPALLLNSIGSAARLTDGRIVIVTNQPARVLLVDRKGSLVRQLARQGSAPGEFQRPAGLQVGGDTITVWDDNFGPTYDFDSTGHVIGERHLNLERLYSAFGAGRGSENGIPMPGVGLVAVTSDRRAAPPVRDGNWHAEWGQSRYVIIDTAYRSVEAGDYASFLSVMRSRLDGSTATVTPVIFPLSLAVTGGSPRHLFLSDGASYRIDERDGSGRLLRSIRKRGPPARFDDTLYQRVTATHPGTSAAEYEAGSRLLPDRHRYPPIIGLVRDPQGNLWVRESMTHWSIFDPQGMLRAVVSIPLFKVFEVGSDYILGVSVDPDGVPSVVELRLTRR